MIRTQYVLFALAALTLAACAERSSAPPPDEKAQVTGTVTYRERIALPPDAVVHVALVDASGTDAEGSTVAEQIIRQPGQVPVPFSIAFDPAAIDSARIYAVRARITDGSGTVRWTTPELYPVLTHGNPPHAEITVHMPGAPIGQRYTCGDLRFTAAFLHEAVELRLPDRTVTLPQVVAASGARYRAGPVEFWIKGDEATLVTDDMRWETCFADGTPGR